MYAITVYAAHAIIGLLLTLWAGYILFHNGRVLLTDGFNGRAGLADAVSGLLMLGFYAANFGAIALNLRIGKKPPVSLVETVEAIGVKVGTTLMVIALTYIVIFVTIHVWRSAEIDRTAAREKGG